MKRRSFLYSSVASITALSGCAYRDADCEKINVDTQETIIDTTKSISDVQSLRIPLEENMNVHIVIDAENPVSVKLFDESNKSNGPVFSSETVYRIDTKYTGKKLGIFELQIATEADSTTADIYIYTIYNVDIPSCQ